MAVVPYTFSVHTVLVPRDGLHLPNRYVFALSIHMFSIEPVQFQKSSYAASTPSPSLLTEGPAVSATDDVPISSGGDEEEVLKLQAEVEQLRKALADRDQANLTLRAQNEQLQGDSLKR